MYFEQADEQPNARPNAQPQEQTAEHIITKLNNQTKLNLLLNYIYKDGDGSEIGIDPENRHFKDSFIRDLERLNLYSSDPSVFEWMPQEQALREKILIWAIKEIKLSPYKIYLNDLQEKTLWLKLLKTEKYITKNENYTLEDFVNYFMACLQEEFENGKRYR